MPKYAILKNLIFPITLGNSQLITLAKSYYKDVNFTPSDQTLS